KPVPHLRTGLFRAEQRPVIAIVFSNGLIDPSQVRTKRERSGKYPWFFKHVRIFDTHFVFNSIYVWPSEFLDHMQTFGVPVALKLRLIVESDRIDDQRVSFPVPNRIT